MNASSLQKIEETLAQLWTQSEDIQARTKGREKFENLPRDIVEGLNVSREVYQNHVLGRRLKFTSNVYPLTKRVLKDRWVEIVKQYWIQGPTTARDIQTALCEFPRFLRYQNPQLLKEFPFLAELANYELTRAAVMKYNAPMLHGDYKHLQIIKAQSDFYPIVNPTLRLCTYEFPIALITRRISSNGSVNAFNFKKTASTLAFYQDPVNNEIKVQQIGCVSAAILLDARLQNTSFAQLAKNALNRLNDPNNLELHKLVFETFADLNQVGLFTGTGRFDSPANRQP